MASRSKVAVFNGQYRNVANVEAIQKKIAALPDKAIAAMKPALDKGADELVAEIQSVTPVAPEFERHPGELKGSVHKVAPDIDIGLKVVVDARDQDGQYYAAHVEYGHRDKGGRHTPAKPFFWPAYNHVKAKLRRRIAQAVKAAVQTQAAPP